MWKCIHPSTKTTFRCHCFVMFYTCLMFHTHLVHFGWNSFPEIIQELWSDSRRHIFPLQSSRVRGVLFQIETVSIITNRNVAALSIPRESAIISAGLWGQRRTPLRYFNRERLFHQSKAIFHFNPIQGMRSCIRKVGNFSRSYSISSIIFTLPCGTFSALRSMLKVALFLEDFSESSATRGDTLLLVLMVLPVDLGSITRSRPVDWNFLTAKSGMAAKSSNLLPFPSTVTRSFWYELLYLFPLMSWTFSMIQCPFNVLSSPERLPFADCPNLCRALK